MSDEYKNSFYDISISIKQTDFTIDNLDKFENKYLKKYNCKNNHPKIRFIINAIIFLRLKFDYIQYNPNLLKHYYNTCLKLEKLFKEKNTEEELNKCKRICTYCNINSFKYFLQKCSRCKSVYYCNYVCQRRDWDKKDNTSHKKLCPILKQKYDDTHFNTSIVADGSSDSYDISSDSSDMNSDTNLELNLDDTSDNNGINTTFQSSLSPYNS
jgi:hypothetical protein